MVEGKGELALLTIQIEAFEEKEEFDE